jgi:uncharacterized protein YbaP (TraB family)
MKKIIVSYIVILSLCFFSCASFPASNQQGSSVWQISKGGGSLFLGGSIHILRGKDFPLPKAFDRAFKQSAMLVLEADIEQMADENVVQYLLAQMLLPGDETLESILDADAYEILKTKCEEYGLPMENIAKFKPSMVMTMLTVLEMQKSGFAQQGVDAYYLQKAKKAKKPLGFLETVEEQIDLLVSMGDGYESDFVKYSLSDMDSTENMLDSLVSEWKTGGASITESSILEMQEQWPAIYKALLLDRNAAWLPQINQYLDEGTTALVIVGLAHLRGPDGLLRQLENSGCIVKQYK